MQKQRSPGLPATFQQATIEQQKKVRSALASWPSHKGDQLKFLKARKADILRLVKAWNGIWLNPHTTNEPLQLQCEQGHTWRGYDAKTQIINLRKGRWCMQCINESEGGASLIGMQKLAQKYEGKCLSTTYNGTKTKLKWQCKNGHIWESNREVILRGHWCHTCQKEKNKQDQLQEMHEIAQQRGGKCLSTTYDNNNTPLTFECNQKHTWQTKASIIRSGRWCQKCHIQTLKLSIIDLHIKAAEHGGLCLAQKHQSTNDYIGWQCAKGHRWQAPAKAILYDKVWCPECSKIKHRLSIEKLQAIAKSRGGKLISTQYINSTTKLTWECELGHQWQAQPVSVKRGTWCPLCKHLNRCKHEAAKRKYLASLK